jgi:hypothetical protein
VVRRRETGGPALNTTERDRPVASARPTAGGPPPPPVPPPAPPRPGLHRAPAGIPGTASGGNARRSKSAWPK